MDPGHTLLAKLRIGEKIWLSSGLVGLLFLAMTGGYQHTLSGVLKDYRDLYALHQNRNDRAREIAASLYRARDAENRFLVGRNETSMAEARQQLRVLLQHAERLGGIDAEGARSAAQITALTEAYRDDLEAIADAWRREGLDHNSGLQGAFRDTAHRLQELAATYAVQNLYIDLLRIRASEKDFGLRRQPEYRDQVLHLLDGFRAKIEAFALEPSVKAALLEQVTLYHGEFSLSADKAIRDRDIGGDPGPYPDRADRIEALINSHYVPEMEVSVLELRRREKDYLLRLDPKYIDMVGDLLAGLRTQVEGSAIAAAEKSALLAMLASYQQDFMALVQQNARIDQLTANLNRSALEMLALVDATVTKAGTAAAEAAAEVDARAARDARLMLGIAALATLLGILLTVLITRLITRPLLRMTGFLELLALEDPVERIPTVPGGRDEINAMAESLNQMADHKKRLLGWWKTSLAEMKMRTQDQGTGGEVDGKPALRAQFSEEVQGLAREIAERSTELSHQALDGDSHRLARQIKDAALTLAQRAEILGH